MPFAARHVQQLRALIDEIDGLTRKEESQFALRRESVSNWSVAEQLDHAVRVCSSVLNGIHAPGETPSRKLNWIGRVVLGTGYIPRGRGKSPKSVLPVPCSREELGRSVGEVRNLLDRVVSSRASESNDLIVKHPYFGGLNARQSLRFAVVHTRHHMKIVREILTARS